MAATIEQWMRDAATEIYEKAYYVGSLPQTKIAECIASHAPSDGLTQLKQLGPYERDSETAAQPAIPHRRHLGQAKLAIRSTTTNQQPTPVAKENQ